MTTLPVSGSKGRTATLLPPPPSPPPSPPLATAAGSMLQLGLATAPLLAVLLYFLWLSYQRPAADEYTHDDDAFLAELYASRGAMIGLMPMLHTFCGVFVAWSVLAAYLLLYVPRRRALVERYAAPDATLVVGTVHYRPRGSSSRPRRCRRCCRRRLPGPAGAPCLLGCHGPDQAVLTYAHPDPHAVNEARGTTYDDDGPARRVEAYVVHRWVTTYRPFTRESVCVALLPGMHLSGQPRDDVMLDLATFRSSSSSSSSSHPFSPSSAASSIASLLRGHDHRDRIRSVCHYVVFPWMAFSALGGLFVVTRMSMIHDSIDVPRTGYIVWCACVFGLAPVIAIGANLVRWLQYKTYKANSGTILEWDKKKTAGRLPLPPMDYHDHDDYNNWNKHINRSSSAAAADDDDDHDHHHHPNAANHTVQVGGFCVSNLCGAPADADLGIDNDYKNSHYDGNSEGNTTLSHQRFV